MFLEWHTFPGLGNAGEDIDLWFRTRGGLSLRRRPSLALYKNRHAPLLLLQFVLELVLEAALVCNGCANGNLT